MGKRIRTSTKSIAIKSARYVQDFTIAVTFTTSKTKLVDFLPIFQKYVKGDNLKYLAPENFRKFIIKNGNIYWSKNEDVIFPAQLLLNQRKGKNNTEEEILYVI